MREAVEDFPGMTISFSQPIACRIDELVAGTRAQLIIKLFGEDLDVLKAKADEIAAALGRVRGATDINVERVAGQPYITVRPDRARIARLGLNVEDVQSVVEAAVGGKTVTQIYEGDKYFDLQVRYPEDAAEFHRVDRGHPRPDAGRGARPLEPGGGHRHARGAQPDQPRVRPAPDRGRVQYQRPRPGRLRRRGPPGDRGAASRCPRAISSTGADSSKASSAPCSGWRSSCRPPSA